MTKRATADVYEHVIQNVPGCFYWGHDTRGRRSQIWISEQRPLGARRVSAVLQYDRINDGSVRIFQVLGQYAGLKSGHIIDEFGDVFPELAVFEKWHMMTPMGPPHYFDGPAHFAELWRHSGDPFFLDMARLRGIWPEATEWDMMRDEQSIHAILEERLPHLVSDFHHMLNDIGFKWL